MGFFNGFFASLKSNHQGYFYGFFTWMWVKDIGYTKKRWVQKKKNNMKYPPIGTKYIFHPLHPWFLGVFKNGERDC
jgi:hypothetical protein